MEPSRSRAHNQSRESEGHHGEVKRKRAVEKEGVASRCRCPAEFKKELAVHYLHGQAQILCVSVDEGQAFGGSKAPEKYSSQDDQGSRVVLVESTSVGGVVSEAIMHWTAQLIWLEICHHLLGGKLWYLGCLLQQVRMAHNQ
ncbi:hypothetical protein YC2023_005835 [Brassica napus]